MNATLRLMDSISKKRLLKGIPFATDAYQLNAAIIEMAVPIVISNATKTFSIIR